MKPISVIRAILFIIAGLWCISQNGRTVWMVGRSLGRRVLCMTRQTPPPMVRTPQTSRVPISSSTTVPPDSVFGGDSSFTWNPPANTLTEELPKLEDKVFARGDGMGDDPPAYSAIERISK